MTDAFLFINVQFLFIDDVMNKLKEISEIIDVHKVQGTYDIIARVHSDTEEKLKELVSDLLEEFARILLVPLSVIIAKEIENWEREHTTR